MEELGAYKAIKKKEKKEGGGKKTENIHKYKLDLGGKRKGKENENMSALARGWISRQKHSRKYEPILLCGLILLACAR